MYKQIYNPKTNRNLYGKKNLKKQMVVLLKMFY